MSAVSLGPSLAALSAVQRRMLAVLADGLPHAKHELYACLWDDKSQMRAIFRHVTALRQALLPHGQTVVCELVNTRAVRYRWVRLLCPS